MQERFSDYLMKANAVFDENGLRTFSSASLERALLSLGDYTLKYSKNHSFLQNKVGSNERRPTWKLLLRGHMTDAAIEGKRSLVKSLLDEIEDSDDAETTLKTLIKNAAVETPWRRMLIEAPKCIEYCSQKMFRYLDGGAVYLISKLRTSSEHVELWTYHLYLTELEKMRRDGNLKPFAADYASANTDDYIPSIRLTWQRCRIEVDFVSKQFRFALKKKKKSDAHAFLRAKLGDSYSVNDDGKWSFWYAAPDEIVATIDAVVAFAREFDAEESEGEV